MVLLERTASLSANLKKKIHTGLPSRAHHRTDRVGEGWVANGLGFGKGDGGLWYRSDLGQSYFLKAGKNYCEVNVGLTGKLGY